ncbi:hypothetical protein DFH06DRAFT_1226032 [Mycena polygramma]|nr:hypothetical protein DFH06DRAFT_1226032 [Mycena polygramma]
MTRPSSHLLSTHLLTCFLPAHIPPARASLSTLQPTYVHLHVVHVPPSPHPRQHNLPPFLSIPTPYHDIHSPQRVSQELRAVLTSRTRVSHPFPPSHPVFFLSARAHADLRPQTPRIRPRQCPSRTAPAPR